MSKLNLDTVDGIEIMISDTNYEHPCNSLQL